MAVDYEERVKRFEKDDTDDRKRKIDDSTEDLIVEDVLVFGLHLMQKASKRPEDKDNHRKSDRHYREKEVVYEACRHLHLSS